ncbi:MAG: hypothetical protein WC443_08570 [Desulfobaccales bacterium]
MKTPRLCRLLGLFTLILILAGPSFGVPSLVWGDVTSWNGSVSDDWFTAENWSNGEPDSFFDVYINSGTSPPFPPPISPPYNPNIATGSAAAYSVTLGNGFGEFGNLSINNDLNVTGGGGGAGGNLVVGGTYDTTSTVTHDAGTVTIGDTLQLGRDSDLDPSNNQPNFYFLNGGTLQSQNVMVGVNGFGYLLQRDTTSFFVSADLNMGQNQTGQGLLDKYGGDLQVNGNMMVGNAGAATYFHGGQTEFDGVNYVYHYGGTTTVGGDLILGNTDTGNGALNKMGQTGFGDLLQVNGNLYVGKEGSGTYNHGGLDGYGILYDGGVTNVNGNLILGDGATGSGALNQVGGAINVAGDMVVGNFGTGTVDQSGGLMNVSGRLTLGANNYGEYYLSGSGSLQANAMSMYNGSTFDQTGGQLNVNLEFDLFSGTVNHSGGTATASYMTLWDATYNLSETAQLNLIDLWIQQGATFNQTGGTLGSAYNVANYRVLGGTVLQSGGVANVDLLAVGQGPSTPGSYELSGGTLNTGQVVVGGYQDWVGDYGSGIFNQTGGSHTVYGDLTVAGTSVIGSGTYDLSGNGELYVYGQEIIGHSGTGTFNQYDPTSYHYADNDLILGNTPDGIGYYYQYDGNLEVGHNEFIGWQGTGTFTQAGGTNTLRSSLILGWGSGASGTYNLQEGLLAVGANERIGRQGMGTFNQTGGSHVVAGDLTLGVAGTGSGTYNLEMGSLEVGVLGGSLIVGDGGTGTFNQNGGTVSASGGLILGQQSTGSGYYYQYDGVTSVGNNLIVGGEGFGRYELYQGTLDVGGDFIVGQSGTQWSSVQLGDPYNPAAISTTTVHGNMIVGEWGAGGNEAWLYKGSSLTVGQPGEERALYVGKESGSWGHFNQQGGDLLVNGDLILGDNSDPSPQFNVFAQPYLYYDYNPYAAGTTRVTGNMIVGNAGTGLVLHKLGSIQVDGDLILGNQAGSFGEYRLNIPYFADPPDPNLYTGALTVRNLIVGAGGSGTFKMGGGSLSVQQNLEVGSAGVGQFYQSGGSVTTNNNYLRLGQQAAGNGYYELSGGSIDTGALSIGFDGTGNFKMTGGSLLAGYAEIGVINGSSGSMVQSGGDVTIDNAIHPGWAGGMTLGRDAGSTGSYEINENNGPATLTTSYLDVGSNGQGTFTQKAGTVNVPGPVYVGRFAGASGTYTLEDGSMTSNSSVTIGQEGNGLFTQKDGSVQVDRLLRLGMSPGGTGSYDFQNGNLTAGRVNVGGMVTLSGDPAYGTGGTGFFTQTGGSLMVTGYTIGSTYYSGDLVVGRGAGSSGTYDFQSGTVSAENVIVGGNEKLISGTQGSGVFTQSGGSLTASNALAIGTDSDGSGSYTMSGGTLTAKDLTVGSTGPGSVTGTLALTNAAVNVTVSNSFTIAERGQFTAAPGASINMTGSNFYNSSTNPNNVDMTQLRMFFSNPADNDTFEVAGYDFGAVLAGWNSNFALGTLDLGDEANLKLLDEVRNLSPDPEALYVTNLIVGDGVTLDLNNLHLYYQIMTLEGDYTFLNGAPQAVVIPLPSTLLLLLPSLLGLGAWRRFRG